MGGSESTLGEELRATLSASGCIAKGRLVDLLRDAYYGKETEQYTRQELKAARNHSFANLTLCPFHTRTRARMRVGERENSAAVSKWRVGPIMGREKAAT
jgi:hypothetical protein